MNETEFAKLQEDGKIEDATPKPSPTTPAPEQADQSGIPGSEWEPLLVRLRQLLPTLNGVASSGLFSQFFDLINWPSLTGWITHSVAGGGATPDQTFLAIGTAAGNPTGSEYYVQSAGTYFKTFNQAGTITVEWIVDSVSNNGGTDNQYLYLTKGTTWPVTTNSHFGFNIVNNHIFASNADGSTETRTDTGQITNVAVSADPVRLKAVYTIGSRIDYYVDNVLILTHTTNLPEYPFYPAVHVGCSTGNSQAASMIVYPILIQKTY